MSDLDRSYAFALPGAASRRCAITLLTVSLAGTLTATGCSSSRTRGMGDEPAPETSEPPQSTQADTTGSAGTSGSSGGASPAGVGGDSGEPAQPDDPVSMFGERPEELEEGLQTFFEPDFNRAPEEIAEERCGYVFRIERDVTSDNVFASSQATQERAFDANGRLLVVTHDNLRGTPTRLQFDYDDQGRVERWRRGRAEVDESGDVVTLTYDSDGSFRANVTSSDPAVSWRGEERVPESGFCQQLDFDAAGRLERESWGCDEPLVARVYTYDDQDRLLSVIGHGLVDPFWPIDRDDRFGEPDEWEIRFTYRTGEETVVWNETQLTSNGLVELEQRLLRTLNENGDPVRVEFDRGNDGSFDEVIRYTYDTQGVLTGEQRDIRMDGVIDWVEEGARSGQGSHLERRNLLQLGDAADYLYSLGHYGSSSALFQDGTPSSTIAVPVLQDGHRVGSVPQSTGEWDLVYDDQNRLISGTLDARAVDFNIPAPNMLSVSSSLSQQWNSAGFVERVEMTQQREPMVENATVTTNCRVVLGCEGTQVALPQAAELTACQLGVFNYEIGLVEPQVEAPYLPPPFDRIPAIQRRNQYALRFTLDFSTIREIVGY